MPCRRVSLPTDVPVSEPNGSPGCCHLQRMKSQSQRLPIEGLVVPQDAFADPRDVNREAASRGAHMGEPIGQKFHGLTDLKVGIFILNGRR